LASWLYFFLFPGALVLVLRQLRIFLLLLRAARAPTPPRPLFWGEGSTNK
jgi:hypothetical protein